MNPRGSLSEGAVLPPGGKPPPSAHPGARGWEEAREGAACWGEGVDWRERQRPKSGRDRRAQLSPKVIHRR